MCMTDLCRLRARRSQPRTVAAVSVTWNVGDRLGSGGSLRRGGSRRHHGQVGAPCLGVGNALSQQAKHRDVDACRQREQSEQAAESCEDGSSTAVLERRRP